MDNLTLKNMLTLSQLTVQRISATSDSPLVRYLLEDVTATLAAAEAFRVEHDNLSDDMRQAIREAPRTEAVAEELEPFDNPDPDPDDGWYVDYPERAPDPEPESTPEPEPTVKYRGHAAELEDSPEAKALWDEYVALVDADIGYGSRNAKGHLKSPLHGLAEHSTACGCTRSKVNVIIEKLLNAGMSLTANRVYQDATNCTLKVARAAIRKYMKAE